MVALSDDEWRHVLSDTGTTAYHHMRTGNAELVDRHAADNGVIVDFHMPRQRGIVVSYARIADHTVVGNVHIDHQQVIVAHFGQAGALRSAAVNGDAFADALRSPTSTRVGSPAYFRSWFTSPMERTDKSGYRSQS